MATLTRTMTYAQLTSAIGAGTLNKGESIAITDFNTVNYLLSENTALTDLNIGSNEVIIVKATGFNTLNKEVQSESYPKDKIYYDWNPANWLNDVSFSSDGINIISGFKGVIYYRKDTINDIETHYDWRNVKLRRWKLNPVAWDAGTTYAQFAVVKGSDNKVYYSIAGSNINNNPTTTLNISWRLIIDYNITDLYLSWSVTNLVIGVYEAGAERNISVPCSAEYFDFLTFGNVALTNENINISIGPRSKRSFGGKYSIINNVLLNVSCRDSRFSSINFKGLCYNSTIHAVNFYYCEYGRYFYNNLFIFDNEYGYDEQASNGGMFVNVIINSRKNNYKVDFYKNILHSVNYQNIYDQITANNHFGASFSINKIGASHARNIWGLNVSNCVFDQNITGNSFPGGRLNGVKFGAGFGNNNCTKFKAIGVIMQYCEFGGAVIGNTFNNDFFRVKLGANCYNNVFYETYDVYFGSTTNNLTMKDGLFTRATFLDGWKIEAGALNLAAIGYLYNANYYKLVYSDRQPKYLMEFVDTGYVKTLIDLATNTVVKSW